MKGSDKAIEQLLNAIDTDKETQELLKSIVPDGIKLKTEAEQKRKTLMSNSIHGTCPHCNVDLDGDLVINYPLSQGKTMDEALAYAASYSGWNEHRENNRWSRAVALYSIEKDRTTAYRCTDCGKTWDRT